MPLRTSSRLSSNILNGWRSIFAAFSPGKLRTVNAGSSASAVPIPVITAHTFERIKCTSRRASSPVIHFDSPFNNAVLPSMLAATLSVTQGRCWVTRFRNALSCALACSAIKPVSTCIPDARKLLWPAPSTPSNGSCKADTTRATFATINKSAQAGPRDWGCRLHGSSVTYTVAPSAEQPLAAQAASATASACGRPPDCVKPLPIIRPCLTITQPTCGFGEASPRPCSAMRSAAAIMA